MLSAGEFVILLHIEPSSVPAAYVQTTAGCLGQIGLNEAGIGIGRLVRWPLGRVLVRASGGVVASLGAAFLLALT